MRERHIASTSLSSKVIGYLVDHGHTQAEIARMLGVSAGFISLVKSRERGLTVDHLERLTEALGVPLGAFLISVTEPSAPRDATGHRAVLVEAMRKCDIALEAIMRTTASSHAKPSPQSTSH